ncbi:MAG: hypothetical protein Q8L56_09825 [Rhodocyclaceae bacterium]|nr:hypothetical protein [Rhodocyclaceae bacterium]
MNRRQLTLIEVLQPRSFQITPERSRVTRTIVQPEVDAFEQQEALVAAQQSALASAFNERRSGEAVPQLAGA